MTIRRDESGATALEYGLLAALIAVAILGGLNGTANTIAATFYSLRMMLVSPGA
ncbi:MAG: Flp family type IVb pilin [Sphingomonadales bacterium]|nr:Flp family type IVb pilin [Sphingomonadales bacterium]